MKELVYSTTKKGLKLYLDLNVPETASPSNKAPLLIWWHGGGLLQGTRKGTPPHFDNAPKLHGIATVSPDYRLAPQARMPDIMEDLAQTMKYIHSEEFAKESNHSVDTSRIVVSGGSAGGWISLLVGTGIGFKESGVEYSTPLPQAIAAIYPISDLLDPFWTTKQHPVSYFPRVIPDEEVAHHFDTTRDPLAFSPLPDSRSICYHYMVQEGILSKLLLDGTGIPPETYSIAPKIKSGEYTAPPTFIIHGSIDDKVPIIQSYDVEKALKEKGLPVQMVTLEGQDHLFDREESQKMEEMYDFIKKTI